MKNFFLLLLLATSLSFAGCGDDDEDAQPFMTATIDGSSFEAAGVTGISDDSFGEELVLILGNDPSSALSIGLNIPTSIGTTSVMVEDDDLGITFTDPANNAFFTVGSLTIDINETENNLLEGTFSFVATGQNDPSNVYTVTNGAFRVNYL